ncbi:MULTISPECIES: hypothetical protein [Brasilonema]|uniref:hypothetical protein n=1 Tax=Brasilonema TaxID=383614 RepID=UPI00155AF0A1|nr:MULTISPECIES: hypothetical protein [Brasilonema]
MRVVPVAAQDLGLLYLFELLKQSNISIYSEYHAIAVLFDEWLAFIRIISPHIYASKLFVSRLRIHEFEHNDWAEIIEPLSYSSCQVD